MWQNFQGLVFADLNRRNLIGSNRSGLTTYNISNTKHHWILKVQKWDKFLKRILLKEIQQILLICENHDIFAGYTTWIDLRIQFQFFQRLENLVAFWP